jgi:hypothetical protein
VKLATFLIGSPRLNKAQLKALSKLYLNLGLLIGGSVVLKFFIKSTEEEVSPIVFI